MFDDDVVREIEAAAARTGMEPAALLAVAEVESGGRAFAMVGGRREPVIRFEGHYFDRRLPADKRAEARAAGLADPQAGAVKNPAAQAARWALLSRAAAIDASAAYESVSWGLGQVMGVHWQWLGYASVDALVADARSSVGGQAELMARYIEKAGLAEAMRWQDWAAFARGYNGPAYKRHRYDRRIAEAYERHLRKRPARLEQPPTDGMLRRGSRGDAVAALQDLLCAAGHPVTADGMFGPATERAVRDFQAKRGLVEDGIAGPATLGALRSLRTGEPTESTFRAWFIRWLAAVWRRG